MGCGQISNRRAKALKRRCECVNGRPVVVQGECERHRAKDPEAIADKKHRHLSSGKEAVITSQGHKSHMDKSGHKVFH